MDVFAAPTSGTFAGLVLDTTGMTTVVALADPANNFHAERAAAAPPSASEVLADLVLELAGQWGKPVRNIPAIAVSVGPGSFTGLRVGLAFAKGLARSVGAPLYGFSSLAALAYSVNEAALVAPVIDARKGEVYAALYPGTRSGAAAGACALIDDAAFTLASFGAHASLAARGQPVFIVGSGASLVAPLLSQARVVSCNAPTAQALLFCAAQEVGRRGGRPCALAEIAPVYLRLSDAERARAAVHDGPRVQLQERMP